MRTKPLPLLFRKCLWLLPLALPLLPRTATAQFNPISLTSNSYTFKMVVPSNTVPPVNNYGCWVGTAYNHGDTTYYEQGVYARKLSDYGGNSGVPPANTTFTGTGSGTTNMQFLMPPSYTTNDDLVIVNDTGRGNVTSGTLTLITPATATNIAILAAGGNGGAEINYTVNHADASTDTGTYAVPDWFAVGADNAWGCDGRINNGGFQNFNASKQNVNPPYMDALVIKVHTNSPVTSVNITWNSGSGVDNFFAISTSADGVHYLPAPITGFTAMTIVAAAEPFPVTATMDNGTNIEVDPGSTWFEQGYDVSNATFGLPPSGSTFVSEANAADTYQMGIYSNNSAILIDPSHLSANITPATPAAYNGLAFLTAGGNIGGGNIMSNTCVVQHQNGVNETNWLFGYDWFDTAAPQFTAYSANERLFVGALYLNNASPAPYLSESFVNVTNSSPITNIIVGYGLAPSTTANTAIFAVSGSTATWGPIIQTGPAPTTQAWYPHQSASITVDVIGSGPITNIWLVESNGNYVPLTNGIDANGSTVSGANTTTLTISDLTAADATNYEYMAESPVGTQTSPTVAITIISGTPVGPIIDSQSPSNSFIVLTNHADVTPFGVTVDASSAAPVYYQWYSVSGGTTNVIAGANGIVAPGTTNIYDNIDTNDATIFVVLSNFVGVVTSSPVTVSIVSTVGTTSAYGEAILALKPVSYWPLNETNGVIAFDHAGTNDGTYVGGFTLGQPGIPNSDALGSNTSVAFDGVTGLVNIPAGKTTLNITGPITIAQWVLTPPSGEPQFSTSFGHSDQSYRLSVANNDALPHFCDGGAGDIVDGNNINDGNWHFLVGVYNGTNQYLYVDGVEQGGTDTTEPAGNAIAVQIGAAPDYTSRNFEGNICQCAIFTNAFTAEQVKALYDAIETPPSDLSISPSTPAVYTGRDITLDAASGLGSPATSYQWYEVIGGVTNLITGATNSTYTLTNAPDTLNQALVGVIVQNAYGTNTTSVTLGVTDSAATLVSDLSPTNAEAVVGTAVTYSVGTGGSLPINFQWMLNGAVQSGATNSTFTFDVAAGSNVVQVSFTNSLSAGTPVVSSEAYIEGIAEAPTITFAPNADWATNSGTALTAVPVFQDTNTLVLTDLTSGESSSAFYDVAQYVGSFTASFTYAARTVAIPSGDGVVFMLQDSEAATNAVGDTSGGLGFDGITNSVALEIDIYPAGGAYAGAVGIALATNGISYVVGGGDNYGPTGDINLQSGDPIQFTLTFANSNLAVRLEDLSTSSTYSTNYVVGSLIPILGSDLAYIGFSGSDMEASSGQTISDFTFQSGAVAPPNNGPTLTVKSSVTEGTGTGTLTITSSAAGELYGATNLANPTWMDLGPINTSSVIDITTKTNTEYFRVIVK